MKQNIPLEITQLWPPYKEGRREGRTGDVRKGRNVKQNKKWHNLEITDGVFDLDRMNFLFQVTQELHHWTSRKGNIILTNIPLDLAGIICMCNKFCVYIVYDHM